MTKQNELKPSRRNRARTAVAAGVLVTGVAAGGVAASTLTASAATPAASTAAAATGSGSTIAPAAPSKSSTPVRSDEKAVSATLGATLKAKALAAVPGGTVYRIETDAGDGVYEAHMTKADGSLVTVKFDKSGNVTKVETGMGTGDPAPAGAPAGGAGGVTG